MKKILFASLATLILLSGCKDDKDWATGEISNRISIENLKFLYKDTDVVLNRHNMAGAVNIRGIVSSDYSKGNMPEGIVTIQEVHRTRTRGIALELGEFATDVKLGDSVFVYVEGKTLTREGGSMVIKGVEQGDVKVLGQTELEPIKTTVAVLVANPNTYEAVLVSISNTLPNEPPTIGQTYEGDVMVTDGSGALILRTNSGTQLAMKEVSENTASYTGIALFESDEEGELIPYMRLRSTSDIMEKYRLLAWDFRTYNFTNDGPTCNATINGQHLEISTLSGGSGITVDKASAAFSAAWPATSEKEVAIENNEYFEFSITPKNGTTISLLSLDVKIRAHANGPQNYAWLYSLDQGVTFNQMGDNLAFIGQDLNAGFVQPSLDVSAIVGVQEFTEGMIVRLYAWGATTARRTFRLGQSTAETPYALSVEGVVQTE